jgi:intracellular sulfur oxidation DsrE/DsrF family protein
VSDRTTIEGMMNCCRNLAIAGLLGLIALTGAAAAAPGDVPQRVVYHIDSGDLERQRSALRNVSNHLNDIGDERLEIRVVAQGDGVSMLVMPEANADLALYGNATNQIQMLIENLRVRGVRFILCGNSLRRRSILATDRLYEVATQDIVDSGLLELVRLQGDGYSYIKP